MRSQRTLVSNIGYNVQVSKAGALPRPSETENQNHTNNFYNDASTATKARSPHALVLVVLHLGRFLSFFLDLVSFRGILNFQFKFPPIELVFKQNDR